MIPSREPLQGGSKVSYFGRFSSSSLSHSVSFAPLTRFPPPLAEAFFSGTPPFFGLWGLAYPDLAAPFTLDADGSTVAAAPLLTSLWDADQLASLGFALQVRDSILLKLWALQHS
jgi:hypothetical protein